MTEKLLSCATLLSVGLMSNNEYNDILDTLFIKMPEDNSLLALEFVSSDPFALIGFAPRIYFPQDSVICESVVS